MTDLQLDVDDARAMLVEMNADMKNHGIFRSELCHGTGLKRKRVNALLAGKGMPYEFELRRILTFLAKRRAALI